MGTVIRSASHTFEAMAEWAIQSSYMKQRCLLRLDISLK